MSPVGLSDRLLAREYYEHAIKVAKQGFNRLDNNEMFGAYLGLGNTLYFLSKDLYLQGELDEATQELSKSILSYKEASKCEPGNPSVFLRLAQAHLMVNQIKRDNGQECNWREVQENMNLASQAAEQQAKDLNNEGKGNPHFEEEMQRLKNDLYALMNQCSN